MTGLFHKAILDRLAKTRGQSEILVYKMHEFIDFWGNFIGL